MRCLTALFAVFASGLWAQPQSGIWQYAHPDAKALVGIDMARIRNSQIGEQVHSQLKGLTLPLDIPGMEFLDSIDRVLLSSAGRNGDDPNQEPPLLIALRGRFEPAKLRQAILKSGARPQKFDEFTVYRPQDKASSEFGLVPLDKETLLIGDAASLFQVLERLKRTGVGEPVPQIVARARQMDTEYEFWAILTSPASGIANSHIPFADSLQEIQGLQAGMSLRSGFVFDLGLDTPSAEAAKQMAEQFTKLVRLAAKDKGRHPEFAGLDKRLKVAVDNSSVRVAIKVDAQQALNMFKSFEQATPKKSVAMPVVAVKPPEPPQKQVIRIEGLDDGPREIPIKQPY